MPKSTIEAINNAKEKTANNTGLKIIFAINYGGRAELVHSIKNVPDELHQQGLNSDIIDETYINNHLMTKDYPDPELLITSGRKIKE